MRGKPPRDGEEEEEEVRNVLYAGTSLKVGRITNISAGPAVSGGLNAPLGRVHARCVWAGAQGASWWVVVQTAAIIKEPRNFTELRVASLCAAIDYTMLLPESFTWEGRCAVDLHTTVCSSIRSTEESPFPSSTNVESFAFLLRWEKRTGVGSLQRIK